MFMIEFCHRLRLMLNGDAANDVAWDRYPRKFDTEKQATTESEWLSTDDRDYVYRVVEIEEESAA